MKTALKKLLSLLKSTEREVRICKTCEGYYECQRFFCNPQEIPCYLWRAKGEQNDV